MEDQYDIVFRGDIVAGFTIVDVKAKLGDLFSLGDEQVDKLFSGRPVAIRRNLNRESAEKFRQSMARVGALVQLRPAQANPAAATVLPSEPAAAPEAAVKTGIAAPAAPVQETDLSTAPVGADVLRPEERRDLTPVQVDTGHLSLDQPGADVLRPDERRRVEDREVDTSRLKVLDPD